jgi:hypothetical protein
VVGFPDQAIAQSREGIRMARELGHPLSTVLAHCFAAWVHPQRGDLDAAMRSVESSVALPTAQANSYWIEYASMQGRAVSSSRGDVGAIADIHQRLTATDPSLWGWREALVAFELVGRTRRPTSRIEVCTSCPS